MPVVDVNRVLVGDGGTHGDTPVRVNSGVTTMPPKSRQAPRGAKKPSAPLHADLPSDDEYKPRDVIGFDPGAPPFPTLTLQAGRSPPHSPTSPLASPRCRPHAVVPRCFPASSSDSDEQEVGVFDIGGAASDSDDDDEDEDVDVGSEEEDEEEAPVQKGGKKGAKGKKVTLGARAGVDDSDDDADEPEEPKLGWGTRRGAFYNADLTVRATERFTV